MSPLEIGSAFFVIFNLFEFYTTDLIKKIGKIDNFEARFEMICIAE